MNATQNNRYRDICKGAIRIPGVKNSERAIESAGAFGWRLNPEEIKALDNASDR